MGHDSFDGNKLVADAERFRMFLDVFLVLKGFESFHPRRKLPQLPQGDGDIPKKNSQVGRKTETLEDLNHVETLGTLGTLGTLRTLGTLAAVENGEIWGSPWWSASQISWNYDHGEFLCAHPASSASPDIPRLTHGSWRTSTPKWISWRKSWGIPRLDNPWYLLVDMELILGGFGRRVAIYAIATDSFASIFDTTDLDRFGDFHSFECDFCSIMGYPISPMPKYQTTSRGFQHDPWWRWKLISNARKPTVSWFWIFFGGY